MAAGLFAASADAGELAGAAGSTLVAAAQTAGATPASFMARASGHSREAPARREDRQGAACGENGTQRNWVMVCEFL